MKALLASLLLVPALAAAQSPLKLGYQGRLLKSDGSPESGVQQFQFALFATPSGGNPLWTEQQALALVDGFYSALLGEVAPLPAGAFDGSDLFLEITVGGGPLSPRQKFGAVAYAVAARSAQSLRGGAVDAASIAVNGVPVFDGQGRLLPAAGEFATQASLSALAQAGTINDAANPLHWSRLKGVPEGFADGADDLGVQQAAAPLSGAGTSASPLSIAKAGASSDGYLASADWQRFDSKLGALAAQAPLSGQGTTASPLVIGVASASAAGALSPTDWQRFDSKLGAVAAAAPLSGDGTPGAALTLGRASGSSDGYLAKDDFAAFDGKVAKVGAGAGLALSGTATQPVLSLGSNLTLGGKTAFGGDTDFGLFQARNFRAEVLASEPTCDASRAGHFFFHSGKKALSLCDGTRYHLLATVPQHLASCQAIKAADASASSGVFTVDPDGVGPREPLNVYCDMSTDSGGWTLVARASDTNGANDYEFRAAIGTARSILNRDFSKGAPSDAQYTLALASVLAEGRSRVEIQYLCYDTRNRAGTEYWAKVKDVDVGALLSGLAAANPDFLMSGMSVENKDGEKSAAGNFAFFARDSAGTVSCGNSYAGQNGIKFSCGSSGQSVMSPRGVWFLTHYTGPYSEVTSCGPAGGNSLPYYAGEIRIR